MNPRSRGPRATFPTGPLRLLTLVALLAGWPALAAGTFALTSDAVTAGRLAVEYTCDGPGSAPALSWSNAPSGTQQFALLMTTLPGDGTTKFNWVLYGIPATVTSLAKNTMGVGIVGTGSHGTLQKYDPPCSQGPGDKTYTFTLYALSSAPPLGVPPAQVTGEVLTRAISSITLGKAVLDSVYARSGSGIGPTDPPQGGFTLEDTLSDGAQRTTLAFAGLGMMTGNLEAQSFFPPGKVADYTGFQYLRDNDPSNMGHNTSFLTRVANNVLYILNDAQFAQLKTLATSQLEQINSYGYLRFPLMKAFRRLLEGDLPGGTKGLDLAAVRQASRELYLIDGRISFDRALLYANILASMDSTQKSYLAAMKGKGWADWPNVTDDQIKARMAGLPQGTAVAVMTYAGDLFSWYAGSVEADVYFCPERQGTYFGSFYIKDAPAIGHEGYGIDEQLTATAGAALCDSSQGYVTETQATQISGLVETQRNNLYGSRTASIVQARTQIATLLRGLLVSTANADAVKSRVLELSALYGELDGENNYHYATVFADVYATLTLVQREKLLALRKKIMSGTYSDGTAFDFSVCTTPYLYSEAIKDVSVLSPYVSNTDYLFGIGGSGSTLTAGFTYSPASPVAGQTVTFTDASTGSPAGWAWSFSDGGTATVQSPTHVFASGGSFTVTLTVTGAEGMSSVSKVVAVCGGPVITAQPVPLTIDAGKDASFSVTATGTSLSYRWQADSGSGFTNLVEGAPFSGTATAVLKITAASASLNNVAFRVIISGACPPAATSNPALLTVRTPGDFTVRASSAGLPVSPGSSASTGVQTGTTGGFSGSISLSIAGLPRGATATLTPATIPAPGTGSSRLTIVAPADTPPGRYPLTVTGTSGSLLHSVLLTLQVSTPPPTPPPPPAGPRPPR